MDLGLEIEKTNVGITIIILKILYVPIFRNNFDFFVQICPKMDFGLEIQKISVRIRIGILEIPFVPIFKQKNTCARVSFLIKLWAVPATSLKKRL